MLQNAAPGGYVEQMYPGIGFLKIGIEGIDDDARPFYYP